MYNYMMEHDAGDAVPNQQYDEQPDWGNPESAAVGGDLHTSPEELLVSLIAARLNTKYLCIGAQVCRAWRLCFYQPGPRLLGVECSVLGRGRLLEGLVRI